MQLPIIKKGIMKYAMQLHKLNFFSNKKEKLIFEKCAKFFPENPPNCHQ